MSLRWTITTYATAHAEGAPLSTICRPIAESIDNALALLPREVLSVHITGRNGWLLSERRQRTPGGWTLIGY